MNRVQILLDSNAYLRLAKEINPLLNTPFGSDNARLFLIREFETEYKRSTRLRDKFSWVMDTDYVLNRKRSIRIPRDKKRTIVVTKNALVNYVRSEGLGVSAVDSAALATGRALSIPVVTDDRDMRRLAHTFKISTMRSLVLLRQMVRADHIDMKTVRNTVAVWIKIDDCPSNFISDYRRIFGERHPRVPKRSRR